MCTLVMSFDDPLGVTTSNGNAFSGTNHTDTSSMVDDMPENKDESPPNDLESERKTSVQLCHVEDIQATAETNTEEQNMHRLNANSWCIAVVTIVLCLLFFLYYCF
uniref:Uncharacterized protein n=1 Tax=Pyxicephalus adspersus TaxID=30357 RepID=A0AAV2ZN80_PYXAD|nr:TPA: hypothetical protein GDO54_004601 [Pyxicephalus adspersus]